MFIYRLLFTWFRGEIGSLYSLCHLIFGHVHLGNIPSALIEDVVAIAIAPL
ncbi:MULTISPECIES: hypothetical protein [unclassified Nostoc]|uniref:hypothetical protein n=1 Tax=unclassified Nostoc TaxID=2593658 RepID=UPI0016766A4B|nr:hypothetical protein [Nostoc sp. 'Peltigera membranacea cyanobiont' 232]